MKLDPEELRQQIIQPTLEYLGCYNQNVEDLLLKVAICHQNNIASDPIEKTGVFPIDAETHQRVWDNYLAFDPDLASKIRGLASQHAFLQHPHQELYTNLSYATAIAWAVYLKFPASQLSSAYSLSNTELQRAL